MEKQINVASVKEIEKKDKSGMFYVVTATIDGAQVEALCFDAKIKTMLGAQTIDVTQKEGKWFLNFGKAKPAYSGTGRSYGKSPADSALQQNSFAMSYSKDIIVALITSGSLKEKGDGVIKDCLFNIYHAIRKELGDGVPKVEDKTEVITSSKIQFILDYLSAKEKEGNVVPNNLSLIIARRLSGTKDPLTNSLIPNPKSIPEMTEEMITEIRTKFAKFQGECKGKKFDCSYSGDDNHCAWLSYCVCNKGV